MQNINLDNKDPRVLVLALRKKQEEVLKLKYEIKQIELQLKLGASGKNRTAMAIFAVGLLAALMAAYFIYSDYSAKTKIDAQYKTIVEQIRQAYEGNPIAHAEIVDKIPEITRRRLPKSLSQPGVESFEPLSSAQLVEGGDSIALPVEQNDSQVEKVENTEQVAQIRVPVRISPKETSAVLGNLISDADVIRVDSSNEHPEWHRVMLSQGFPSWVPAEFLDDDGSQLLKVNAGGVRLRVGPQTNAKTIGLLSRGTLVNVVSREGAWIQVRTPANFRFWVKSEDFSKLTN